MFSHLFSFLCTLIISKSCVGTSSEDICSHPDLCGLDLPQSSDFHVTPPHIPSSYYMFNFSAKSVIASDILICCGQTASQLLQPKQALGSLSFGYEDNAIGAINQPFVKQCSL